MCHFKDENADHIKRAIDIFDWESTLNCINADDQVSVFNLTIQNTKFMISLYICLNTLSDIDHHAVSRLFNN